MTSSLGYILLWISYNQRSACQNLSLLFPSTVTATRVTDQCISEDPGNVDLPTTAAPGRSASPLHSSHLQQHKLTVHMPSHRSLSTTSSIDDRRSSSSTRNFSISSARRASAFDGETQRMLERQQTQERLANIRTTFTLFIVTATFLLMYLPSIIHTLFNIKPHDFREILFLLYYVNSAVSTRHRDIE
jgi:hypothetical protein